MNNKRKYGYINNQEEPEKIETQKQTSKPRKFNFAKIIWRIFSLLFITASLPFRLIYRLFAGIPKKNRKTFFLRTFWLTFSAGIMGIVLLTVYATWISRDLPDPDKLSYRQVAQSTRIFDRTGKVLLAEIFTDQKRTLVELTDVPVNLKNAVVATEDKEFYTHNGFRPLALARSIVYGLLGKNAIGSGASTITQQLVKNAILDNSKSYSRKLKEIVLSVRLEQKYTKDQILKMYLNEIPYGSANYGVEAASQSYFGKHVSELNLQESATLAGIPQSPSRYPRDMAALKIRRNHVLDSMLRDNYITKEQADAAKAEPVTLKQNTYQKWKAPHFVQYVLDQLTEQYGEEKVNAGGLSVITSLDWNQQQIAEKIVSSSDKLFIDAKANDVALVSMDPKTGQVLSMIGSKDFFSKTMNGQFNVAVNGQLQPGSSIKPIIYSAAFEKGYTPDTLLYDVNTDFNNYTPKNYDLKEHGLVTMRKALQGSLNIPAVQTLWLVGIPDAINYAERLGYTTLNDKNVGLSLVLGGGVVKPIQHLAAYSIFANGGIKHDTTSILKVEDVNGNSIFEWHDIGGERVLDQKITDTLSNVLSDNAAREYMFGLNSTLTLGDRPVAAKSGTTQNYKDAWTAGYTPSLAVVVWAGNDDGSEMKPGSTGGRVSGVIWNSFMKEVLKGTPIEQFPAPLANDAEKPILRGTLDGMTVGINRLNGKLASSSTPPEYIEQRTYYPAHSILYYVNKDDPRGPAPEHPELDAQFNNWENALQDWIKRNKETDPNWNVYFADPPTEVDGSYSSDLSPIINIITPAASSTITSRQLNISVGASAPRGVTKVSYYLDTTPIGDSGTTPFNYSYYATWLNNGVHTLRAIAVDDAGNMGENFVQFTLSAADEQPGAYWITNKLTVTHTDNEKYIYLNTLKIDQVKKIIFYQEKDGLKTSISEFSDFSNLFNNQILLTWPIPQNLGLWKISGQCELKNGSVHEIQPLGVEVQ